MATSTYYPLGLISLIEKRIGYLTDDVKAMLTTSAYVPAETDQFVSDVTDEITGTGYTTGGQSLTSKTVTSVASGNGGTTVRLGADNPSWTGTFTARRLVFYIDTTDPLTSPLLAWVDFETDQVVNNEAFTYVLPTSGLVTLDN